MTDCTEAAFIDPDAQPTMGVGTGTMSGSVCPTPSLSLPLYSTVPPTLKQAQGFILEQISNEDQFFLEKHINI